jgi:glutamate-ammonia-ligase adenylyltransferase
MTLRSDLDLIAVYDPPAGQEESDGPRPLDPATYHARLWKRIISAVTVPTRDGALYEVDMRLRPSGNAGPVVTSLESFRRYHREQSWTWEHMALTRARVVAGPPVLAAALQAAIRETLTRPRAPDELAANVAEMRERIGREHPPASAWDAKYRPGGLIDIEFLVQYLQLAHGHAHPEVLEANTATALMRLADAALVDQETAADLLDTLRIWQAVQGYVRLTVEGVFHPEAASPAVRTALARLVLHQEDGPVDLARAERAIDAMAERAHGHYRRLVETRAGAP